MGLFPGSELDASRHKAMFAEVVGISNPDGRSFTFLLLFLTSLGWFADTSFALLQAMLGNVPWSSCSYYLIGICPFFVVTGWGWSRWRAARRRKVQLRATARDVDPHTGVILFLSKIGNPQFVRRLEQHDPTVLDAERFPWKMCHYALERHRSRLRRVWVVCSADSAAQYHYFVELLRPLFPEVTFDRIGGDGVDFEDMEAVVETIEQILHSLPPDIDESDVMIDITGGQKPNSIAGALVTLVGIGREFQYVQTNPPHGVKTYAYHIAAIGRRIEANG